MTNEQLAELIKNGHFEYIDTLWQQMYKFISMKAYQYYELYNDRCNHSGITKDDLFQEGYFALLDAVQAYKADGKYKFITMLNYPLLNRFNKAAGRSTARGRKEPLNRCTSLDVPIGEDEQDSTLIDVIPDKKAEQDFKCIDTVIDNEILRNCLNECLSILSEREQQIIKMFYFHDVPTKDIAEKFNVSVSAITQMRRNALSKLRISSKAIKLQKYRDDIISTHGYRGTLSDFLRTGTSSVEWAVLNLERGRI